LSTTEVLKTHDDKTVEEEESHIQAAKGKEVRSFETNRSHGFEIYVSADSAVPTDRHTTCCSPSIRVSACANNYWSHTTAQAKYDFLFLEFNPNIPPSKPTGFFYVCKKTTNYGAGL
jgi:hypothetical protein